MTVETTWSSGLTDDERATLQRISRDTLTWCTASPRGEFSFAPYAITARLQTPRATFVTLMQGGGLRGCMGCLMPEAALCRSIHDNAMEAGLHDPRFPPVTADEVSGIAIKLSVLGPFVAVDSPDAISPGVHGVVLMCRGRRAVFLPEVALEQGWNREQMMDALCRKAGLPGGAWRAGCTLQVFQTEVF